MDEALIKKAKTVLPDLDYIIDLYDNGFVWANTRTLKLSGYTLEEFTSLRNFDTLNKDEMSEEALRKINTERITKGHGTATISVQTKAGKKLKMETIYKTFTHDGGQYLASKATNL